MLKGANGYTLKSRLDDMATEGGRGGCCTQAPTFWGGPTAGGGGNNYHVEDRAAHNLAAGVGPVYSARCPSATDAAMVSTLKNFADANAHNPPSCNNYRNNYQHQPVLSAETCGAGSSTASTTSTATCSTTSTIPPPQPSNGCVTDKVMGVVSSKYYGRLAFSHVFCMFSALKFHGDWHSRHSRARPMICARGAPFNPYVCPFRCQDSGEEPRPGDAHLASRWKHHRSRGAQRPREPVSGFEKNVTERGQARGRNRVRISIPLFHAWATQMARVLTP